MTAPKVVVAENLLLGQPASTAPHQVRVSDIMYLPLVLSGHLARCLFTARGGLAPRPTDAHITGAHGPGANPNAMPAGSRPSYPRRP